MTILSSCSNQWSELHDLTAPNKQEYCDRWSCKFVDHRTDGFDCWDRPKLWLSELQKIQFGDYLWFFGADTLIMNQTTDWRTLTKGNEDIIIGLDVNGLNIDVIAFKYSFATIAVLKRILELRGRYNNEQDAAKRALGEKLCDVKILPQRYLNSYLYEYYKRNHPEDYGGTYESGDFVLHCPGMELDSKLKVLREYLPKVIK
jgi:hypothetical protein